ncbi:MurR/RpiR family transcriptional regulator [Actinomadura sp. 6N118]|uniref:MurR/RpiR family transcriptional regulator n=1 Tax=Actinomadura sp. 6N118 TaxID=3375151 RepID=UPI00379B4CD4
MDEVRVEGMAETIRRRLGDCSPAERKVARVLLASYPSAGFETVARLAERAKVSPPTVLRFANRLGYDGFPEFQRALRDELDRGMSGLGVAPSRQDVDTDDFTRGADALASAVAETFAALPPDDAAAAIALLSDVRRRVYAYGGRFSHLIARYLALQLAELRPGVRSLPDPEWERAVVITDLARRDVLVLFDFRPYEDHLHQLAAFAVARGSKVILFTDTHLSPIAALAEVVLPSRTEAPPPHEGLVAAHALAENVVAGVLTTLGGAAAERRGGADDAARSTGLY